MVQILLILVVVSILLQLTTADSTKESLCESYTCNNNRETWISSPRVPGNNISIGSSSSGNSITPNAVNTNPGFFTFGVCPGTPNPTANFLTVSTNGKYVIAGNTYSTSPSSPGTIYISSDYGNTFAPVAGSNNMAGKTWYSVDISDIGDKMVGAVYQGGIYLSLNYGLTWKKTSAPTGNWWEVVCNNDCSIMYATFNKGNIYITKNTGTSWSTTASVLAWTGIQTTSSGSTAFAVVDGGSGYITTNTGASWIQIPSTTTTLSGSTVPNFPSSNTWRDCYISASGQYMYAIANSGSNSCPTGASDTCSIYQSKDYGVTWVRMWSGLIFTSITCSNSGQYIIVLVPNYGIIASNDFGKTATLVYPSNNGLMFDIAMNFDATFIYAVTRLSSTYSSDGGKIFMDVSFPTSQPSMQPTSNPSNPSSQPSGQPSSQPSRLPTAQPSRQPSAQPSVQPSLNPIGPSAHPTGKPSSWPSLRPSSLPTGIPSSRPSPKPTSNPTKKPSPNPSHQPSFLPSPSPTFIPSSPPTAIPTELPRTISPSFDPTFSPSEAPTMSPSFVPTYIPTAQPTNATAVGGASKTPSTTRSAAMMGGVSVAIIIIFCCIGAIYYKYCRREKKDAKRSRPLGMKEDRQKTAMEKWAEFYHEDGGTKRVNYLTKLGFGDARNAEGRKKDVETGEFGTELDNMSSTTKNPMISAEASRVIHNSDDDTKAITPTNVNTSNNTSVNITNTSAASNTTASSIMVSPQESYARETKQSSVVVTSHVDDSSTSKQLPPDWTAKIDPSSGTMYYINKATKQTQWDFPTIISSSEVDEVTNDVEEDSDQYDGGRSVSIITDDDVSTSIEGVDGRGGDDGGSGGVRANRRASHFDQSDVFTSGTAGSSSQISGFQSNNDRDRLRALQKKGASGSSSKSSSSSGDKSNSKHKISPLIAPKAGALPSRKDVPLL